MTTLERKPGRSGLRPDCLPFHEAIEAASVGLIILLGIIILSKKGYAIDTAQLTLEGAKPSGIVFGLVIGVFSFVGFESATTLGDEAKHPLRNIPRSVLISTIVCGIFFVIMSYIEVLGFQGASVAFNESTAPLNDLAQLLGVGFFGILILIGSLISLFAYDRHVWLSGGLHSDLDRGFDLPSAGTSTSLVSCAISSFRGWLHDYSSAG